MHALIAALFGFAPITNGTPDSGDDAVVAVRDATDRIVCTGTLIAEHVVLTAAHCLPDGYRGMSILFVGGSDAQVEDAVDGRVHPEWTPATGAHDIAVLFLRTGGGYGLPIPTGSLESMLAGASVRLVGFGDTAAGADDRGTKHAGRATVMTVRPDEIELAAAPSLACTGDSGGPVLIDNGGELIAAVISRGDSACTTTVATRVDAHLDFIAEYLADTAPGTATLYERCLYAEHCGMGACVTARDEPLITYCAPGCGKDRDCTEPGTECIESRCHYRLPTPGAFGAACTADAECAHANCAAPDGADDQICTERCVPGVESCPTESECLRVVGAEHACFPTEEPGCGCDSTRADASWLLALLFIRRARNGNRGSAARRETRSRDSSCARYRRHP